MGKTIGIKLRFDDFKSVTRDSTLPDPTADASAIRHHAGLCLKRVPLHKKLRLLGVRAGSLMNAEEHEFLRRQAAPVQQVQTTMDLET